MQLRRASNQKLVTLETAKPLGAGGEARVFGVAREPHLAAKIYHNVNASHIAKLKVMIANPPKDPKGRSSDAAIAWPLDLLLSPATRQIVGFLMPRVSGRHSVINYFAPTKRLQICPLFNYRYLHQTARNLASAVHSVHERGHIIGDINESNVLVAPNTLVTLVDTDSFQVRQANGQVFLCTVGKPEYTPPELHRNSNGFKAPRAVEHDNFGLAVLCFYLLMEGFHPFAGSYSGSGDPPQLGERIARGLFPYSRSRSTCNPPSVAPPFGILHPTIQEMFRRCFEDGSRQPKLRPSAAQWRDALTQSEKSL